VAILDYAPHGGGHGHPDKLQLLLYAGGQLVAPDVGSIHYGVPLHREWYKQTVSHNTVVVDGQSQKPCRGKLLRFHATPELAIASASADDAYDGVRFARTVAALPGGIVVDLVELASDEPHQYDWLFHCYGEPGARIPVGDRVAAPGTSHGYQHIRNWHGAGMGGDEPIVGRWQTGRATVTLHMLAEPDTLAYEGEAPGRPPSRKLPTLIVRRRGTRATFLSAFRIGGKDVQPVQVSVRGVEEGEVLLTVQTDDGDRSLKLPMALGGALPGTSQPKNK
jgi:hypothetical protein